MSPAAAALTPACLPFSDLHEHAAPIPTTASFLAGDWVIVFYDDASGSGFDRSATARAPAGRGVRRAAGVSARLGDRLAALPEYLVIAADCDPALRCRPPKTAADRHHRDHL